MLVGASASLATGCGLFGPTQPIFTARGRVVDDAGKGVPGAVVTDGQMSTLTDESGRFTLAVFDKALAVAKPGKAEVRTEAAEGRELTIAMDDSAARPAIGVDGRWASKDLDGLRETLAEVGKVSTYGGTNPSRFDVLVMVTPGTISEKEEADLGAWVRDGGRLVLCGEWGGYPDQSLATLNALATPAGIGFPGATVRDENTPEGLAVAAGKPTPASLASLVGTGGVTVFAASNLTVGGAARPVLASGAQAYSVLATGGTAAGPVLAAVGPAGLGKVFALGDSSLWRDEDSEGAGTPNVRHGANAAFAAALVGW